MEEISFRDMDELAGKDAPLPEWDKASERERFAINVRRRYRPARALVGQPGREDDVVRGMWRYALAQQRLDASKDPEPKVFFALVFNTRGCVSGFLENRNSQNNLNHKGLRLLLEIPKEQRLEDWHYVYSKIFFGLLEKDQGFFGNVSLDEWKAAVDALEEHRSPNFPGRALFLARHLFDLGEADEAIKILERASAAEYGKDDQLREVEEFLARL